MTLETPEPIRQTQRIRCTAHKTDGTPCGAWAIHGATVCRVHGGSAPQVKKAAEKRWAARLDAMVDPALERLEQLSESAQTEAVKLRATDSILDRGGVRVDAGEIPSVEVVIRWPE